MRRIRKVVIPVAGLGTRFLPVTKVVPKELLPIIDTPIIHHVVQEAVAAGIENIIFITSRPKVLVEDYFDPKDLVSYKIEDKDKTKLIEETLALSKRVTITSIRQYEAQGLGHAILQAAPALGEEDFAVLLGDEVDISKTKEGGLKSCVDRFTAMTEGSVIGVTPIEASLVSNYGVAEFSADGKVSRFVEKPKPNESSSNWILPGRYVFENSILKVLKSTPHGRGNEIQLTDAMETLLKSRPFYAQKMDIERYDTGDKIGFIKANIAQAFKNEKFRKELTSFLKENFDL
ncbi:UTP--glucose-1-phosphate uridylyltransferase [bacterium]|nr:UTP--glucose-1-phosphate uridylyltransferase [bacterium]